MSIANSVLYGSRLYDTATYSTNQDPQTFTASLSESVTLIEARDIDNIHKVLSESFTMTEFFIRDIQKPLSDTIAVIDTRAVATEIKALTDFIILKEWLNIRLVKADVWVAAIDVNNPPIGGFNLYGSILYDANLYSDLPATTWVNPPTNPENFTNADGQGNVP